MASPDPSRYPHHLYSHQDHQQLTSLPPLPPPPPPPPSAPHHHQSHLGHDVYGGERPYHHYPEHPPPPPPPPHQAYPPPPPQPETEQPLDLSVSRSPRPPSAGSSEGGASKRPRLEDGSRDLAAADMSGRGGHSSLCMIRGCNCHSPMPIHHTPHYSRHRHSPYPQYPVSGHSSPSVGEVQQPQQPYPHPYSIPQPPPPSSPGLMYGGGGSNSNSSSSSSSTYLPPQDRHLDSRHLPPQDRHLPPQDRHSRSPGMGVGYSAADLRPSPGALLCPPPPHSSISPLSISTHGRDASPCPPPHPPPPRESLAPLRDMSPRPFYRPFEDMPGAPQAAPVISSSGRVGAMEPYPSEDDLSASSTLLMLSNTTSSSKGPRLTQQTADSSADSFRQRRMQEEEESAQTHTEPPTQSDSGRAGVFHQPPPLPPPPPPPPLPHTSPSPRGSQGVMETSKACGREAVSQACHKENQPLLGPAQDGTVASSYSSSDDLTDSSSSSPSPKQQQQQQQGEEVGGKKGGKSLQSRLVKVVGTTPLATLREERAKKQAAKRAKMRELLTQRSSDHYGNVAANNSNDSEGASDHNSSGQASPRSTSDGSDNDVGQGFPIPPDPNLKMSALDYLISKVLVERIDVPFKACNSEIQQIYSGAKKGRLTLVDLIELQVEASLKA